MNQLSKPFIAVEKGRKGFFSTRVVGPTTRIYDARIHKTDNLEEAIDILEEKLPVCFLPGKFSFSKRYRVNTVKAQVLCTIREKIVGEDSYKLIIQGNSGTFVYELTDEGVSFREAKVSKVVYERTTREAKIVNIGRSDTDLVLPMAKAQY